MKKTLLFLLCLLTLTACSPSEPSPSPEAPPSLTVRLQPDEPEMSQNPVVTITMDDGGIIQAELYPDKAPNTVANFVTLIQAGFYDGLTFHRTDDAFMIQGGDPDGSGRGGPGYTIAGEFSGNGFTQNDLTHERGILSTARTGDPNSAGSQFFIMVADFAGAEKGLDGVYAAFGRVTEGMDVVDSIASGPNTGRENNNMALEPRVMKSVTVETFGAEYTVVKNQ